MAPKPKKKYNFSLTDDFSNLRVTITTYSEKDILSVEKKDYALREISEEELLEVRLQKKAGFILKIYDTFFYTQIPKNFNFLSSNILGNSEHLCKICPFCSPKPDCEGGCLKIRNVDFKELRFLGYEKEIAIKLSERIEKYDFIELGCESFHTNLETLIVASCSRYEQSREKNS